MNTGNNRLVVQIISSLIFFPAALSFLFTFNLLSLVIAVAAAYVWYSIDYKFIVPREKFKRWNEQRKNRTH